MRIFAPDTIKNLMGRFGIPEDEPIENRMVNRSLESAQTKIEGFNFDARKHVLEFDNVLDRQRRTVYERRSKMLVGSLDEVEAVLQELAGESEEAKQLIKKKEEELGREQMFATARNIVLQTLDMLWVEHLESMEYLRGSVNLRAYGQRDPLTEYRKEGTRLYRDLEMTLKGRVFELLEGLSKDTAQGAASLVVATPAPVISVSSGRSSTPQGEIGRNDPCPCGSGKKWKKCGMLNTPEHQQRLAGKK